MKWRLVGRLRAGALASARLVHFGTSAHALLATILRPRVGRALAVLFFFSVIAVTVHAASMNAAVTLTPPPVDLGLVGWWTLDASSIGQTVRDYSGFGDSGYLSRPKFGSGQIATTTVPGVYNQAFDPYKSNAGIVVPPSAAIDNLGPMTVSIWERYTATTTNNGYPLINKDASGSGGWGLSVGNGGGYIIFNVFGASSTETAISHTGSPLADGNWHMITATWNGVFPNGALKVYNDGVLVDTYTSGGGGTHGSDAAYSLHIGCIEDQYWNGPTTVCGGSNTATGDFLLDDAKIYRRALSASDIQALYDATASGLGLGTRDNSPTSLLTNGLVGYWTFDGNDINWNTNTATDLSGSGYTLDLQDMSTTSSPALGRFGQGLALNPAGGTMEVAQTAEPAPTKAVTMSTWFSPTGTRDNAAGDIVIGGNGSPFAIGFERFSPSWSDTTIEMQISTSTSEATFNLSGCSDPTPEDLVPHQWYLITGTFDGSYMKLYLNGLNIATCRLSGGVGVWDRGWFHLQLGGENSTAYIPPGVIDDVRIYDRALSPTEIMQLYDAGAVGTTIDQAPTDFLSNGLVGYWPFDGNEMNWNTNQALDASGNGNSGTLINMSTTTSPVQGVIGQALAFTGVSGGGQIYVEPFNAILDPKYAVTVSTWYSPAGLDTHDSWPVNTNNDGDYILAIAGSSNTSHYIYMRMTTTNVSNDTCESTNPQVLTPHAWYLITGTYDGSNINLYLNGQNIATCSLTGEMNQIRYDSPLQIGGVNDAADMVYGALDDVRIYDRALSASEVKQLYNLGR